MYMEGVAITVPGKKAIYAFYVHTGTLTENTCIWRALPLLCLAKKQFMHFYAHKGTLTENTCIWRALPLLYLAKKQFMHFMCIQVH